MWLELTEWAVTYQPNEEKEDLESDVTCEETENIYIIYLESPAAGGDADHVPVAHRGHGDHEEVDTVPVGEALAVLKVRRVPGIFQLKTNAGHLGTVFA